MSLLRNGDGDNSINFQKASCTLDGCVKIWTSRVDSVATETGKLLSGLAEDGRKSIQSRRRAPSSRRIWLTCLCFTLLTYSLAIPAGMRSSTAPAPPTGTSAQAEEDDESNDEDDDEAREKKAKKRVSRRLTLSTSSLFPRRNRGGATTLRPFSHVLTLPR